MDVERFVWNEQNGDIWRVANELHDKEGQMDVYLLIDNVTFSAHKLMLAAASPFLKKVLGEHYHEHRDTCVNITMPGVSPDALNYILKFIYYGELDIPIAFRKQVLEAAKLLEVISLIKYIQLDSVVKLTTMTNDEHKESEIVVDQNVCNVIKAPSKRRGRKKKISRGQPLHKESSSAHPTMMKKEMLTHNEQEKYYGTQLGRSLRKIKSRYSSDIYEVILPKLRKCKVKGLQNTMKQKRKKAEQSLEENNQSSSENKNHHSDSINQDFSVDLFVNDKEREDSKYLTSPPSRTRTVLEMKGMKTEDLIPDLLTVPSTSSSSIVVKHLFASDASCVQEPSRLQSLKEVSCASFIEPQTSSTRTARESYDSSSLVAESSSSSLLSELKELPVAASPTMQVLPMKQVSGINHPQETSDSLKEKNIEDEEREEDGLLKWQVLLKECENFTETVTPAPNDSVGDVVQNITVKYQDGGVDINQWISEEFHSYITPGTGDAVEFCKEAEESPDDKVNSVSTEVFASEASRFSSNDTENKATYGCEKCGRVYTDLRSCQSHIRGVHLEARHMCKYCGKMFKRRCDLYQHERRHNSASLPCKFCQKIFKLPKDLAAHMMTHSAQKRFHCSHCNKQLTSYRNLRNHIASIHQKQRAFACHLCSKTYSKSCSLQVHIRSVHTGERPFKCVACNKEFCDSALLKLHKAIHTGECRYSCKVCGRRFNQYSNMVSHQRIHTNDRPFACLTCKQNFKTREGLLKHKLVHTGLKPLQCCHCSKEFHVKESYEKHMLRFHGETISLPKIFFEVPEEMSLEEPSKNSSISSEAVFKSIGDSDVKESSSVHISSNLDDKLLEKAVMKNESHDSGPVAQLVRGITQEGSSSVQLTRNDSGQVQLSYPLFPLNTNEEGNVNVSIGNMDNQISNENGAQSIDVDAFLHGGVSVPSSSTVVISKDSQVDDLSSSIAETAISECEEVVILSEVSEGCAGEFSNNIHQSSTIKIWIPSERSVAEDADDGSNNRNILIVSDQTFTNSDQTLPVLSSRLVTQEVGETIILNRSQDKPLNDL